MLSNSARSAKALPMRPLSIWDSEYGSATFLLATVDIQADLLLRLRTNLCLEGPTKPRRSKRGAAPKHGIKFNFKDPATWWEPDQVVEYIDPDFGVQIVRIWKGLRFRNALACRMTVALVERPQASRDSTQAKADLVCLGRGSAAREVVDPVSPSLLD